MYKDKELSLFLKHIMPITESGCWIWMGSSFNSGYGCIKLNGKTRSAHRLAWELYNGPIPKKLFVLHKCDVPLCCRPDHLYLGTPQ